jgi:hypothetical protein
MSRQSPAKIPQCAETLIKFSHFRFQQVTHSLAVTRRALTTKEVPDLLERKADLLRLLYEVEPVNSVQSEDTETSFCALRPG